MRVYVGVCVHAGGRVCVQVSVQEVRQRPFSFETRISDAFAASKKETKTMPESTRQFPPKNRTWQQTKGGGGMRGKKVFAAT